MNAEVKRNFKIGEVTAEEGVLRGDSYFEKGNFAIGKGNLPEASRIYKDATYFLRGLRSRYPGNKRVVQIFEDAEVGTKDINKWLAEDIYNSGLVHMAQGEHVKAKESFQDALKKYPKLINASVDLGNILITTGEYEKAHRVLKAGLANNQDSKEIWKIWNGLGKLFLQIGEFPRAYTCYSEVKELHGETSRTDYNLGLVFLNLQIGDPAVNVIKSLQLFEKAERVNPNSSEITNTKGVAWNKLAEMRVPIETVDNYETSLNCFNEAIEKDPKNIWAWYNRAKLLPILKLGKPKDWLKETNRCFDEVLKILNGENKAMAADVWYQKALVWEQWSLFNPYREKGHKNKDLKRCVKCLDKSLKLHPTQATHDMLTRVKMQLDEIEQWSKFGGVKKVESTERYIW